MLNYQGAVLDREFLDWGYLSYTWLYKQGYIAITKNFVDPNMIYPGPSPGHQTTEGGDLPENNPYEESIRVSCKHTGYPLVI